MLISFVDSLVARHIICLIWSSVDLMSGIILVKTLCLLSQQCDKPFFYDGVYWIMVHLCINVNFLSPIILFVSFVYFYIILNHNQPFIDFTHKYSMLLCHWNILYALTKQFSYPITFNVPHFNITWANKIIFTPLFGCCQL